jgi:hypothetical protein
MLSQNFTEDQYSTVLEARVMEAMKEVFNGLDVHGDLVVRRAEFIHQLKVAAV